MPTTVSALFLKKSDAKKALAALTRLGLLPEQIAVADATVIEREEIHEKESLLHRLFSKHHGVPEAHSRKYEDHVRNGAVAVAVSVGEDRVDEIVDLLNYHGAKDFSGAHLNALRKRNRRTGAVPPSDLDNAGEGTVSEDQSIGVPLSSSSAPAAGDPFAAAARRDTTASGTAEEAEEHSDIGRRSVRRGGVRVYSSLVSVDDAARDGAETRPALTLAEHQAAYRFGFTAAAEPHHHTRPFEAAEPELRQEFRAAGANEEWEKVRDAVREGWEKQRRPQPV